MLDFLDRQGTPPDYGLWSDEEKAAYHREGRASFWTVLRRCIVALGAAYVLRGTL